MTKNGKIAYWTITFILAFMAGMLHNLVLDIVFFILNMLVLIIIKSLCKKPDESSKNEAQQTTAATLEENKPATPDMPDQPLLKGESEFKIRKCTGNCSTCERDTCIEDQEK